tara:strand:+ start:655 stop:786 length:132 start_codon:yes stop_codon:yes gene_type:complete
MKRPKYILDYLFYEFDINQIYQPVLVALLSFSVSVKAATCQPL